MPPLAGSEIRYLESDAYLGNGWNILGKEFFYVSLAPLLICKSNTVCWELQYFRGKNVHLYQKETILLNINLPSQETIKQNWKKWKSEKLYCVSKNSAYSIECLIEKILIVTTNHCKRPVSSSVLGDRQGDICY